MPLTLIDQKTFSLYWINIRECAMEPKKSATLLFSTVNFLQNEAQECKSYSNDSYSVIILFELDICLFFSRCHLISLMR